MKFPSILSLFYFPLSCLCGRYLKTNINKQLGIFQTAGYGTYDSFLTVVKLIVSLINVMTPTKIGDCYKLYK